MKCLQIAESSVEKNLFYAREYIMSHDVRFMVANYQANYHLFLVTNNQELVKEGYIQQFICSAIIGIDYEVTIVRRLTEITTTISQVGQTHLVQCGTVCIILFDIESQNSLCLTSKPYSSEQNSAIVRNDGEVQE